MRHAGYQDDRAGTAEAGQDQGRSGSGDGRPPGRGFRDIGRHTLDQGGGNPGHHRLSRAEFGAAHGLGEVQLPFPIADETIAFEVAGDSMLPKYENGDIIVVYREQRHPVSSFYGEEAAVRLKTGERRWT